MLAMTTNRKTVSRKQIMEINQFNDHIQQWDIQGSNYVESLWKNKPDQLSEILLMLSGYFFGNSIKKLIIEKPQPQIYWTIKHKLVPTDGQKYWDELCFIINDAEAETENPQHQFLVAVYLLLQSDVLYSNSLHQIWMSGANYEIMIIENEIPFVILPPDQDKIVQWFENDFYNNKYVPEIMPAPLVFARIYWQEFLRKNYPKKTKCVECGSPEATHAHHEGKEIADLAREGLWHHADEHHIVMLCAECHFKKHEGTRAANFLKVFTVGRQKK